jgi:hypothetical protein
MHIITLFMYTCSDQTIMLGRMRGNICVRWIKLAVTDEGTTPWVLTFGLPDAAQEQDGHSKPKAN